ncbi:heterodisulfide reductase [candidate division KSB1 bacterium]|nr:MAG: heterodisulfide reductase [candidate division KSB1 bacterium]RKY80063.1 MAG: heterodisulfide reductase [candidate division KSB1 bacterium]RKY89144.1 MAG: heterodisulfide reductase [candidate division KSB1 bacterium]
MIKKLVISSKNVDFLNKINELSGETITLCDQCGTCSGSCPMVSEMDITPSQMMRMVQLGQMEVMDTKAMWICASCFACTVRCPRGLDLAKVAEALRQVKLREAIDHIDIKKIPEDEVRRLPQIALVSSFRKFTG